MTTIRNPRHWSVTPSPEGSYNPHSPRKPRPSRTPERSEDAGAGETEGSEVSASNVESHVSSEGRVARSPGMNERHSYSSHLPPESDDAGSLGGGGATEPSRVNEPRGGSSAQSRSDVSGRSDVAKPATPGGSPRAGEPSRSNEASEAESSASPDAVSSSESEWEPDLRTSRETKIFVVDTNVLLHNPNALFVFKEHDVVIPSTVIEELDKMKRKDDDLGRNARECIRHLDRLRGLGRLIDGVNWGAAPPRVGAGAALGPDGRTGTIRIDINDYERPPAIREEMPDNRIIAVAYHLHRQGKRAVFVSKDLSARIKSDSLGIRTEDFENQKVNADQLYTGFLTLHVEGQLIDDLYHDRLLALAKLDGFMESVIDGESYRHEVLPNQYVVLRDAEDENHTGLGRRLSDTDHLIPVTGPRKPVFGIMARNVQQTMALDLLMDDDIKMITLLGSAGTGKTLVAIAAGMSKVFHEERYERLLVARPIMPMGRDIGYLPGDKDEKLGAWMQPIFDNLGYLLSTRGAHTGERNERASQAESHTSEQRIAKLMADGKLVLEPLTYIRGRSIAHQFMIVDEAQNLTPHEVKTIASRVGEGTKLILTGDIGQIDNPYLDQSSNGLSYAIEKMKGLGLFGHVTLAKSERSELASLAASRL
jgi:PhoH-like ATPase